MKVVSLFCGSGGLDLGFKRQGLNIIYAIDFFKAACETYKHNIGDHVECEDINEKNIDDIPDADVYIIGSSCTGFSNANRQNGFLNNPNNLLVKRWVDIIKKKQPSVFVSENVPQMLTKFDGAYADEIKNELSDYHIEVKILNSVDYGVSQVRKRAIIIGSKIGKITHPEPTVNTYKTVQDALNGITYDTPNQSDYSKSKDITLERIKSVPPGGNIHDIPEEIRPKGTHSNVYKRLELDKPSVTITNPRKAMLIHPTEDRILSVRECAAIQSFPNDFVFYGNLADKQQQVANAVPPLMSDAIAKQIRLHIEGLNK